MSPVPNAPRPASSSRWPIGVGVFLGIVIAMFVGPRYLSPLPFWLQLALILVGCCLIAAIALYVRRKPSPPR